MSYSTESSILSHATAACLKSLGDKGPTDNMNMEDLLDRLLMRLDSHMTGTLSVPSSHQVPLASNILVH